MEETRAAVVLAAGQEVSETELIRFVAAQLAPFKAPRRIVIRDGKIRNETDSVTSGLRPAPVRAAAPVPAP